MADPYPYAVLARIWDILVAEAGAPPSQYSDFLHHWPGCYEYRFQGFLGFGGKIVANRPPEVICYREDETPERLATIERTNLALADAVDGHE